LLIKILENNTEENFSTVIEEGNECDDIDGFDGTGAFITDDDEDDEYSDEDMDEESEQDTSEEIEEIPTSAQPQQSSIRLTRIMRAVSANIQRTVQDQLSSSEDEDISDKR